MSSAAAPTFDPLVANPARLRILAALARQDSAADFVTLRRITSLSDGNLVTHARKLNCGGLVAVHKSTRDDGRIITTYRLTASGRDALELHARQLQTILSAPPVASAPIDEDDEWID
jgi:DNA-binding MarR family transcriptional regulator